MPRQVYRCPEHGEFEMITPLKYAVPKTVPCPRTVVCNLGHGHPCPEPSKWVPSAPNFIGGPTTGAKPSLPEE